MIAPFYLKPGSNGKTFIDKARYSSRCIQSLMGNWGQDKFKANQSVKNTNNPIQFDIELIFNANE